MISEAGHQLWLSAHAICESIARDFYFSLAPVCAAQPYPPPQRLPEVAFTGERYEIRVIYVNRP